MAEAPTEDQVLDQVRQELKTIKVEGAEDAGMGTTWTELDVDSLDLVELVKSLEDTYGIDISDDDLKPIQSVGDAVNLTITKAKAGATA